MVTTLCVMTCMLATTQTGERPDWLLAPRLGRGQELVYGGTFVEESNGPGVRFNRTYRLETRVFSLDAQPQGHEVAVFTVLKQSGGRPEAITETTASSARLELARIDLQGRVTADPGVALSVPLEGPPSIEWGVFIEAPDQKKAGPEQSWEVREAGRPTRSWRVVGNEMVNGATCVKLVGAQQSEDWDRPRADRTAWRRRDTVWVAPRLGVACRVERVIERRDPARIEPTHKSVLLYDLQSSLQYPGQLFEDRRREIQQARSFSEAATALVANAGKYSAQIDELLARITSHFDRQPPTPYRDAIVLAKRRLEAAKRGEAPAAPPTSEETTPAPTVAELGKPAPDFVTPDFLSGQPVRLRNWTGRPVLLVFYTPSSPVLSDVLKYSQNISDAYKDYGVTVLGLAVSEDGERVRKQRDTMHVTFPILSGTGLLISYAVEATPKMILLDGNGIVRGHWTGWGAETAEMVTAELRHWLPRNEPMRGQPTSLKK